MFIYESGEKPGHHFMSDFSYQFLMIQNDDQYTTIEVKSNFGKNAKGFKVCYPSENTKKYKLLVEPG